MMQQQLSTMDKLLQSCLVKLERIDVFTCDICHVVYCEEECLTRHLATHVKCEGTVINNTEITMIDGASRCATLYKKKPEENTMDSEIQQPYISIRDRIMFESDSDIALSDTESSEDSVMNSSSGIALSTKDYSNEKHVVNKRFDIPRKLYTNKLTYQGQITVTNGTEATRHKEIQVGKQYSCEVCSKSFLTKTRLDTHLKTHNLEKSLTCNFCEKKFMFKHQLKVHERIHNNKRPYSCKICNMSFRHYSSLSHHRRLVHKNLNDPTNASERPTCAICNKRYGQKTVLLQHIFNKHKGKGYPCSICKKEIGHPVARDWHMNIHKGTFKCSVCGKCYLRKGYSNRCEITHKKPFECSNCNMKFGRKDHLSKHLRKSCTRLLPNPREKLFECQKCDAKYVRKDQLTRHSKLHCEPKNQECPKCKLRFAGTLKTHNIKCKWKKYECDHCKKTFGTKNWMARHIIHNICRKN